MQPMGRVIEVLGAIDDPGMEIEIAVRKFDVPAEFSADALKQAQSLPREVRPQDFKGRVDLREVPFITIDGEDARDFDDAIYIQEIGRRRVGKECGARASSYPYREKALTQGCDEE